MRRKISLITAKLWWANCRHSSLVVIGILLLSGTFACVASEVDNIANKAYQLRLDGKVDEAKTLLEEHLSANPDDANANYELCRTYLYILTSKHGEPKSSIENAKLYIEKALKSDPENIAYLSFDAQIAFIDAFMALQSGNENGGELIRALCEKYDSILKLQPNYGPASLYLAEIYGNLPPEMGGDPAKAEQYVKSLEQYDEIIGAKARVFLMPDDADYIEFWNKILEKHPGDAAILEELGKTYLRMGKTEEGIKYLHEAMKANPRMTTLHLDIARYYIYSMMGNKEIKETYTPLAEAAFNDFLATDPISPLKAFAIGWQAQLKLRSNDKEGGEILSKQAEAIDRYYSKATAIPSQDLFIPPGEVSYSHNYLFQPF